MRSKHHILAFAHSDVAYERAKNLLKGHVNVYIYHPVTTSPVGVARTALAALRHGRPALVYLVDIGVSTAIFSLVAWLLRVPTIVDTGDLAYELARTTGGRSRVALGLIYAGEQFMLLTARAVVVRGVAHQAMIPKCTTVYVPDVAAPATVPKRDPKLRHQLGFERRFVVGLVGSLRMAPRLGIAYGWDLVEAIALLPKGVVALIIGDGDARSHLEQRAHALGAADRCVFAGRIPQSQLAPWIGLMDAAISTQTNNDVGAVRTTGKLPLYLAYGCPVLASDVGEAHRLLGPLGWTVRYDGVVDAKYPSRLAKAIAGWANDPAGANIRRQQALDLSAKHFDINDARERVLGAINLVLSSTDNTPISNVV